MQVRPLTIKELPQFAKIESHAFVFDLAEAEDWVENVIKPELPNTRGLFEDDDEVRAVLRIIYPRLWLGQTTVAMAGITNVATPPEYRRQGAINHLLTNVLHEVREAGFGISTLYPFYFPFYKKFGYELASTSKSISLRFESKSLQKFRPKTAGQWKAATAEQWLQFNQIYEGYCQGSFGNLTRDEENWWKRRLFFRMRTTSEKTPYPAYIWLDAEGKARAYIIYQFEDNKEKHERYMWVRDMAWLDAAAMQEVYAFIANHDSQADKVSWNTSPSDNFLALLDDPREAEEKLEAGYMLRIVDAVRALQERPWPEEVKGSFTIALRDNLLEWNNLALRVEVAGGKAEVTALPDADKAGLSCDIRQLAQLYAGYLSPQQLIRLNLLEVRNSSELDIAQKLFSPSGQPASHMIDHF